MEFLGLNNLGKNIDNPGRGLTDDVIFTPYLQTLANLKNLFYLENDSRVTIFFLKKNNFNRTCVGIKEPILMGTLNPTVICLIVLVR